jgi:hypothetical protein
MLPGEFGVRDNLRPCAARTPGLTRPADAGTRGNFGGDPQQSGG